MTHDPAKKILIFGMDEGRWGPARLVAALRNSGFEIAALCSTKNPLFHSSNLDQKFELAPSKSWRAMYLPIISAIRSFGPDLIVSADEMALVLLQHVAVKTGLMEREDEISACVRLSLGRKEMWLAKSQKMHTRLLAERLGIPTPQTVSVASASEALAAARRLELPVYLKKSFAWACEGNRLCESTSDLPKAFAELSQGTSVLRAISRKILRRDWFPASVPIEVQKKHPGHSAMYNVVAHCGKVLDGFYAIRASTAFTGGPSTCVSLSANDECRGYAEKLVGAMGATGFLAFDFIWDLDSQRHLLLECNPRPNQISHLGERLGANLCDALARAMAGEALKPSPVVQPFQVALFPQYLLANPGSTLQDQRSLDVPESDAGLLAFMMNFLERKGIAGETILQSRLRIV